MLDGIDRDLTSLLALSSERASAADAAARTRARLDTIGDRVRESAERVSRESGVLPRSGAARDRRDGDEFCCSAAAT